jgi:hypothetical protein
MKSFIVGMVFVSGLAHAQNLKVTNFSFNYKNPHGTGVAASFSRDPFVKEKVEVEVDKIDNTFKFLVTGAESHEFEFMNAPSFMTEADTMSVTNLNLSLNDKLNVSIGSGRFNSGNDSLKLDGFQLECLRGARQLELMDQFLSGCTKKLTLISSKFSSQEIGRHLKNTLESSLKTILDEKIDLGVNSVELRIKDGKFELTGEVKAQLSGKVTASGTINYESVSGKMTLNLSEVKFGIINITSKVFEEIKKNENDHLQVKRPFVYYMIK